MPRRVLVIRLGAMGDIIHALPAVATLKTGIGDCHLTWLVEPRWSPLLQGNPFVDEVWELDRSDWSGIKQSWTRLREGGFDVAVDLQGLIKSALCAFAASPHYSFGFHYSAAREKAASLLYTNRIRTESRHVVDRYLDIALAAAGTARATKLFPLPQGAPEGTLPDGPFILASPFAGWAAKQWPLEHYSRLARLLANDVNLPLVVNGPPESATELRRVEGAHVHLSGLPGLIDATRRAVGVVGVDSGPLHMAAALKIPGVAIFGPTDPARNGPYGDAMTVLRDADAATTYKRVRRIDPAMAAIAPERVMDALKVRLTQETR
ncbi:MAG: glycosyltransferase family 9 protein [Bryobacteraceae bacterium]